MINNFKKDLTVVVINITVFIKELHPLFTLKYANSKRTLKKQIKSFQFLLLGWYNGGKWLGNK